ncbi:MAG: MarR family transcriptional regulator [Gammaproteobacteria bacterium]|nr:MarR family transcriptional regulator [Gammaproteobacteria bacterium]
MEQLDVMALIRLGQNLERNVNVALMYSGLRIPQFRLLDAVAERGQATVTELSEALHITRATASVMVNELIRSGSVAVLENEADRRSFHVRLTEDGLYRLQSARSDLAVLTDKLSNRYPEETTRMLNELTRKMALK